MIDQFLKWKHKEDRLFGYFLYLEQDYNNFIWNNLKKDFDKKNISSRDFDYNNFIENLKKDFDKKEHFFQRF